MDTMRARLGASARTLHTSGRSSHPGTERPLRPDQIQAQELKLRTTTGLREKAGGTISRGMGSPEWPDPDHAVGQPDLEASTYAHHKHALPSPLAPPVIFPILVKPILLCPSLTAPRAPKGV